MENLNTIENFEGWQDNNQPNFFDEIDKMGTGNSTAPIQEETTVKSKNSTGSVDTQEKPKEKSGEEDYFSKIDASGDGQQENEGKQDGEEEAPKQSKKQSSSVILAVEELKNRGIIDYELAEGAVMTDEIASEIIEDEFDFAVENKLQQLMQNLPPELIELNKYVMRGGKISEFLDVMQKNKTSVNVDDLSDEKIATQFAIDIMLKENPYLRPEDAGMHVQMLKDNGRFEDFIKDKSAVLKQLEAKQREELLKQQEENYIMEREFIRNSKAKLSSFISNSANVGDITFNRADRNNLPSYIYDKTVKLEDGSMISAFENDLRFEIMKNPFTFIQIATLLRNRNENGTLNFNGIKKQIEKTVITDVQNNIRRTAPTTTGTKKYGSIY